MRTAILIAGTVLVLVSVALAQAVPPFNVSRLYLTEAEFTRAIQPYQQAIQANARNSQAQYWLGYAYVYAYRQSLAGAAPYAGSYLERAIPPLNEAIKIDPTMVAAYLALQDVYFLLGDREKAEEVWQQMFQRTRPGWLPKVTLE